MISTSSYKNWNSDKYRTYSISGDRGRDASYSGDCYLDFAPRKKFWRVWKDNRGKISDEENNRFYVQEYWNQVLSKLDPEKVYRELDNSVLLCYEDNDLFCHRHIVAYWFEILLGVDVFEEKANDYDIEIVDRPEYIKQYLEDAMRNNRNLRGFNSLRALYLFEKGEMLEQLANDLDENDPKCLDYRQRACYLRCDADEVENKFNTKHKQYKKTKY